MKITRTHSPDSSETKTLRDVCEKGPFSKWYLFKNLAGDTQICYVTPSGVMAFEFGDGSCQAYLIPVSQLVWGDHPVTPITVNSIHFETAPAKGGE